MTIYNLYDNLYDGLCRFVFILGWFAVILSRIIVHTRGFGFVFPGSSLLVAEYMSFMDLFHSWLVAPGDVFFK